MNADGPVGYLDGDMEHYDRRGLEVYMAKHNVHSTNEAKAIVRVMTGEDDGLAVLRLDKDLPVGSVVR